MVNLLAMLIAVVILLGVILLPVALTIFMLKGVMVLLGVGVFKALIIILALEFAYEICKAIIEVTLK